MDTLSNKYFLGGLKDMRDSTSGGERETESNQKADSDCNIEERCREK